MLPILGQQARGWHWGQGEGLSPESWRGGVQGMEDRDQERSALCLHHLERRLPHCEPGMGRCGLREEQAISRGSLFRDFPIPTTNP